MKWKDGSTVARGIFEQKQPDFLRSSKGFTLLEILIAVVIFAVVLGALYSTFFLAHRALFAMDHAMVQLQESRAFVDILKREIESALYAPGSSHTLFKIEDRDFFGRQASELTMSSFSPLVKGLVKISYRMEGKNGRLAIMKSVSSDFSQDPKTTQMEFLEDVESFTLEAKYTDKWVKTWDSSLAGNTPEEVRIVLAVRIDTEKGKVDSAAPFRLFDTAVLKTGRVL
jgi:general secretion pathway protein J